MDSGTKISILIFIICSFQSFALAKKCTRPNLKRHQVFIYRTMGQVNVKVYRCLYNNTRTAYSDISDQCLSAVKTGKFLDKWDQTYNLANRNSPIVLEEYVATADPLLNTIYLRSGTVCRFDRGFCYDPTETLSYAAVWDIIPVPPEKCPTKLEQVFYGHVDVWTFSPENQKYLFFSDMYSDKSFSLKIENASKCHGKPVWYTKERGYIISLHSLTQHFQPTKKLNKDYFPLKSKKLVSEVILKDCDLSAYSLDFDDEIRSDYLEDPKILKVIFNLHQKQIDDNKNNVEQFAKNLKKIRAFVEGRNKDVNSIKVMLALYKMQFDSLNNSINSLYGNMNGNGLTQNDYDKLKLNDKDLSDRISKMGDIIKRLENSIKMSASNNQISKEDLEQAITNLKMELNKNYTTLTKNISNSRQIEINDIRKLISEIENTISKKLEPKIVTANNFSKICNEKVDNINDDLKKSLNELKNELYENAVVLEKGMTKYVDKADSVILKKLDSTNLKLQNLKEKIKNNIFKNEDDLKITVDKLEYLNKTTALELEKLKHDLTVLDSTFHTNYDGFNQKVEGGKKHFENELILIKDSIESGNKNLKNEIINMYLVNSKDISTELIKINGSLSSRIDLSGSKIQDIEQKINNIKRDAENDRNSANVNLQDIIKDVAETSQKINSIPAKIEEDILKKLNPTINSIDNKSNNCNDKIENLKINTDNSLNDLKRELTELFKIGDEIVNKNLQKAKDSISNKVILDDTKVREFENKLNECRNFAEYNKILTEEGLQDIKRNISEIFDYINQASSAIDNNILNKYNSILSTLEDKNKDFMQQIANLKDNFDKEKNDLEENQFQTFIAADEEINRKINNINSSFLNKINSSDSKTEQLESKIVEFNDKIKYLNTYINSLPSKIEDEIAQKFNPSLSSLQKNNDNCDKKIKDLKDNVKNRFDDIRNELFIKFSSSGEDLQKVNNSILQIIDAYDKRIQHLEIKIKSLSQATKTKSPSDTKIEYLIKQADSTYKTLENNIYEINNIKAILKKLDVAINNLNSDNKLKELYLSNLNQTVVKNTIFLKQLEDDINSIKNSGDIVDIDKQTQKHRVLIRENSDNINKLEQSQQGTDKIVSDLRLNDKNTQQLLKQFEHEIQTLRNNLSLSNHLISVGDKTIMDLRSEVEDLKSNSMKKQKEFTDTLSNFQNILNRNAGVDLIKELADLKKCCSDNDFRLIEKEREIKELKDEFRKAIKELKTELDKLKYPQEVESV